MLGFSDHTPYPFGIDYVSRIRMDVSELENYVDSICRLRDEYKKDIQILGQHCFDSELTGKYASRDREEEAF